jgi:iron complex transport system ATP-binding protein
MLISNQMDNTKQSSISFKNLIIGYDNSDKNNFPVISSQISGSEFIVLLGRNGIGKSTLLRTLAGLQSPVAGELNLMGQNINRYSQKEKAALISFVSTEKLRIANLTVFDLVSLGRYSYTNWLGLLDEKDRSVVYDSMKMAKVLHLANNNINEISDGELQRVMIARTLAQNTPVIILDEPTSFLDLPNKFEILLLLRKLAWNKNKTIILSTHDLDMAARIADNIWIMTHDGLEQGAPEDFALNRGFENLFVNTGICYNYNAGIVDTGIILTKEITLVCNDSHLRFWTHKALNRLGFNVTENADTIIEAQKNRFDYKHGNIEKSFTTIYDLSKYLISSEQMTSEEIEMSHF